MFVGGLAFAVVVPPLRIMKVKEASGDVGINEKVTRSFDESLIVDHPLDEVFPFFANAENLEKLTPDWLKFSIDTPTPIEMKAGALIDYKIRFRGIPMKWRTEIKVWEPPFRFVDTQLKGPYSLWHHEHLFEEVDGGTRITDRIHYRVLGGKLIDSLIVRRDVEAIFAFRKKVMGDLFVVRPGAQAG